MGLNAEWIAVHGVDKAAVLQRLCAHLRPGGYLFLGHSETIVGVDLPVRTVSGTVFQKV